VGLNQRQYEKPERFEKKGWENLMRASNRIERTSGDEDMTHKERQTGLGGKTTKSKLGSEKD